MTTATTASGLGAEAFKENQALHELVNELRSTVEHVNKSEGEKKEKLEKIEKALEVHDARNAELTAKFLKSENEARQLKEDYEFLEKKLASVPQGSAAQKEVTKEAEAFELYVKEGPAFFQMSSKGQELFKYLRTDVNPQGGYLAPIERVQELIKLKTEISPVRSVARVMQTDSKALEIPRRDSNLTATWGSEGSTASQSQETYGNLTIDVKQSNVDVTVTRQLLAQSNFNIVNEIYSDAAEDSARLEGQAFILGSGPNQPQGILTNPNVQAVPTGDATTVTSTSLITITGELKQGYNPAYMFNRRTLAYIRNLRDSEGRFLWTPTLAEGEPARINGEVYILAIDLPDYNVVDGNPVLYGDFYAGYRIVDGMALEVFRDDYTQSAKRQVVFRFTQWVGAMVVLPEAIKKLVVSVS